MDNLERLRGIVREIHWKKDSISMGKETAKAIEARIDNWELPNLSEEVVDMIKEKANEILANKE